MGGGTWRKALTSIQRPTKAEWAQLDPVTRWLIVTRASVLVITWLTAFEVGLFALRDGLFRNTPFLLVTIGLVLAHATNNMLNDVIDWLKGVDQGNYYRIQYGGHIMELMSRKETAIYLFSTGLTALIIAVYLVLEGDSVTLYCAASGAFFLLFYTYPLKYIGLGEVSVFLVWGILMVGGGYHAITGVWSWKVVLEGAPLSLGITVIIFGKHIDKLQADRTKGILTLPVLLGDQLARYTGILLMILQYVIVVSTYGVIAPQLLVVFALPRLWKTILVYSSPAPKQPPPDYPKNVWPLWFVGHAFRHAVVFGGLFVIGTIIDIMVVRK